jgi:ADP-heptose:LPS heptosyltransferase
MNILLVKIGALGDVVFALPAAAAIKAACPDARVTWAVGGSFGELLDGHPHVDRRLEIDDRRFFSRNPLERTRAVLELGARLERRYDLILIAHRAVAYATVLRPLVRGIMVQLARSADDNRGWRGAVRMGVVVPPRSLHESLAIRQLVEAGLAALTGEAVEVASWSWDYAHIDDMPDNLPASFVVVHAGGGSNPATEFVLKRWPHVHELVEKLVTETDHDVVLVGGPSEAGEARALAETVAATVSPAAAARVHDLVGRTSIRSLVGVLRRARLVVGVDSGPLHLADSLGVPCVGLYGATSPVSWGLLGERAIQLSSGADCSPCYRDDGRFPRCPYGVKCMVDLSVGEVLDAVNAMSKDDGNITARSQAHP